jgi:hypothetical protein
MRTILTAMVVVIAFGGWARAEGLSAMYDPRVAFQETDTNQDGVIDRAEFQERLTWIFYKADLDKNGYLDVTEQKKLVFPEDFATDDRDHDGRVSLREFLRIRFIDYDKADTDRDGVLSLDEVVAVYEAKGR